MKKILIATVLAFITLGASAQRSATAIRESVDANKLACENPKKAEKPATWLNLAKDYKEANTLALGSGWVGASREELTILMSKTKLMSSEAKTIGGKNYTIDHYKYSDYYFYNNILEMIVIVKPVIKDDLELALAAYKKAAEVDAKGSKTKEIKDAIKYINNAYVTQAVNQYAIGNFKAASANFSKAYKAAQTEPFAQIDTASVYNSAFTASLDKNYEKAITYYKKCLEYNYTEKGDIYARLADCYDKMGDKDNSLQTLQAGFAAFPNNQMVLIGLINFYITNNEDPNELFVLLDKAKKNEPNNASLWYVEGNIYKEMGDEEKAVESYDKCININPEYEYGEIGKGVLFYNKAISIAEQAQKEFDDNKYNALAKQCEEAFLTSAVSFEKGYVITKSKEVQKSLAEYLKNIYYRFQSKGEEYKAKYEKYAEIVKQ